MAGRGRVGSAVGQVDVAALGLADVELAGAADLRRGVLDHLAPLGDPAREAAEREEDGEHARREAHGLVDEARVEVDVGVEPALHEVVVIEGDLLEPLGQVEQRVVDPERAEDLVGGGLDDRGSGVVVLVDPVAEAHEADLRRLVLDLHHEVVGVLAALLERGEHLEHGLVGAAVEGTEEGVDARRHRREEVGLRGADEPHGGGRAVLLVVGVQDEEEVERLDHGRVELEVGRGHAERHPKEVLDEAEVVVGVEERLPDRLLERVRRDGRQLRQQADRRDLDLLVVEGVEAVLVEGRERRDRRGQHRHRVGVAREALEEALEVLVEHRVLAHPLLEVGELGGRGEVAVDEEVGGLEERRVLRELLDGVSPVAQDPLVAVDVGDRARAARRVDEATVEGDVAGLLEQGRDVVAVVALGGLHEGEVQLLVRSGQGGTVGHVNVLLVGHFVDSTLSSVLGAEENEGAPVRLRSPEAANGRGDAFVGRRERDAHVLCPRRSVEVAGGCEDAARGQPLDRHPARLPRCRPEVEPGLGVVHAQAEALDGRKERGPARGIPRLLVLDVSRVGEGREHGALHRPGHHHPRVLAHFEEASDERRVARHEGAAVAREVRLLGEGVDAEEPLVRPTRDPGVEDRRRRGRLAGAGRARPPVELGIALVGRHDHPVLAGPADDLCQVLDAEHLSGRVARSVEPQQLRRRRRGEWTERGERVDRPRGGTREPGADVVRRVRHAWVGDDVIRAQAHEDRQPCDELLGADGGEHTCGVDVGHPAPRREPRRHRLAQVGSAPRQGVAVRVGGRREGLAHDAGRGVDGSAHGEVDEPRAGGSEGGVGEGARPLLDRSERVPGEVGEAAHPAGTSSPTRRAPAGAGRR